MPTVKARSLEYGEDEEHILRRLGAALAIHWETLPEFTRVMLLEQAVMIEDRHQTVQLKEQIKAFIDSHKDSA